MHLHKTETFLFFKLVVISQQLSTSWLCQQNSQNFFKQKALRENTYLCCPLEVLAVLLQHPFPPVLLSPVLCACPAVRRTLPKQREQISTLADLTMGTAEHHSRRLCTYERCPAMSICTQHREARLLCCLGDTVENISSCRIFKLLWRMFQSGIWALTAVIPAPVEVVFAAATSQSWSRSPRQASASPLQQKNRSASLWSVIIA